MTEHERALELLAEMEAKASAAADGPWITYEDENWLGVVAQDSAGRVSIGDVCAPRRTALFIASVRTDAPRAYAALRAVMEMHTAEPEKSVLQESWCSVCGYFWPCPTVRAVAEKLAGGSDAR